jgi:hypothetical protein
MSLFKKAAVFTDIHFGLKSNSQLHNEDCLNFVKWATTKAKEEGCETAFFLGDWHNNRASINIITLSYSLKALEHLNANFDRVYFIPGNHDLYYRDKRDVQSVEWAKHLPNVQICNDWFCEGDVVIAPWLVADDHKRLSKLGGKYCFGHFELPGYFMNAMVQMPDLGEIKPDRDLVGFESVFTGHFHKRQHKGNVHYIGNCFPHNYADAQDDDRGMMILEWDKEPEFHAWPDQPRYRVYNLGEILKNTDHLLKPNMHCRVNLDIDISYEEATFIKEQFIPKYQLRELTLLPNKNVELNEHQFQGQIKFESVDQIVSSQLNSISSEQYNRNLLMEIYRNL